MVVIAEVALVLAAYFVSLLLRRLHAAERKGAVVVLPARPRR